MDQRATGYKNTAPKWQFALISKTTVTRAKHNTDIHTQQTTLNRIRQSGIASVEDQLSTEAEIKCLEDSLDKYRTRARLSHKHYIEQTKLCEESMKIREARRKGFPATQIHLNTECGLPDE